MLSSQHKGMHGLLRFETQQRILATGSLRYGSRLGKWVLHRTSRQDLQVDQKPAAKSAQNREANGTATPLRCALGRGSELFAWVPRLQSVSGAGTWGAYGCIRGPRFAEPETSGEASLEAPQRSAPFSVARRHAELRCSRLSKQQAGAWMCDTQRLSDSQRGLCQRQ